jgi:predicted DNA-binding transcriptional regulator AlpA
MSVKFQDQLAYPPRLLRADRAAAYFDISKSKFLSLVAEGVISKPVVIGGVKSWDRIELDAVVDAVKENADQESRPNSFDRILATET